MADTLSAGFACRIYIRRAHAYAGHPLNLFVKM